MGGAAALLLFATFPKGDIIGERGGEVPPLLLSKSREWEGGVPLLAAPGVRCPRGIGIGDRLLRGGGAGERLLGEAVATAPGLTPGPVRIS